MLVKCEAKTCKYESKGMCIADSIQMIDFDYYKSKEDWEKDKDHKDDTKCNSYKYDKDYLKK